ncbi:Pimeloyl-ACP methyl ester carboxylesterase [Flavobacterium resistens]|uniref:Alpha/beta fold hydrolase n=1 Tax=Flavobacterium resistens TaxID=443612 RepID=A0A521ATL1_9FLAO|nr:epoxide hydrolase family protein [Flavobacterium resistens]MRX68601.1 alpha/beta fold hydrolase [Flavobacterium resistens]SMO37960.1 Pimeloyl-ACP methyl ester carboxylesterase [Flavobacterium resistens]
MKNKAKIIAHTLWVILFSLVLSEVTAQEKIKTDESIRPYRINISNADLKDLKERILDTKWPTKETVSDQSQGANLSKMKDLVHYWCTSYDWRKAEAKLNAYPQFVTKIDGVDIHFIHVRSKEKNAMPLILSHGWPGSVFEFINVIGPLTNPVAYGGKAEDAFDVIIPSLPGFGFSGKPTEAGWDIDRIAKAWAVLMNRLEYKQYVAQGGDWGAGIVNSMALQAPKGLLGIHSNLPATLPTEGGKALASGIAPESFSAKERASFNHLSKSIKDGDFTYKMTMTTRPQAVGYALNDSPAGLAAWLLLHPGFANWSYGTDPKQSPTKDEVLDDISLYWLTNSATSAARIYWENRNFEIVGSASMKTDQIKLPVAITVFPEDVFTSPETWAHKAFKNLIYFHEVDKGGHFAAWEQPQLFTAELRLAFKSLR